MHPLPIRITATVAALTCGLMACGSDDDRDASDTIVESVTDSAQPAALELGDESSGEASDVTTAAPTSAVTTSTTMPPTTAPPTTIPPTEPPTTVATTTTIPFPPSPRVLLVGDSTLQAVDRYGRADKLLGMDPVLETRSCRLLGVPSCSDDPPPNAVATIDSAEGLFDMIVIMAGYDEWYTTFSSSWDQVVNSARAKGAKKIIWLSYPEGVPYLLPDGTPGDPSLVQINQIMRDKVASGAFPDVVIADWFHYSYGSGWFNDDGIHLSPTGADAVADYISRKVAFLATLPCPMPREPGGAIENPCPDPDVSGPVPDIVALYGG